MNKSVEKRKASTCAVRDNLREPVLEVETSRPIAGSHYNPTLAGRDGLAGRGRFEKAPETVL